jgi:hypothetical protein
MFACCVDYDGEGADVGSLRYPKARKEHTCCECFETIRPGEIYEYATACFDGSWGDWKTCATCCAVRNDHGCYGGDLWNRLRSQYGAGPIDGDWQSDERYGWGEEDPMGPPPRGLR